MGKISVLHASRKLTNWQSRNCLNQFQLKQIDANRQMSSASFHFASLRFFYFCLKPNFPIRGTNLNAPKLVLLR